MRSRSRLALASSVVANLDSTFAPSGSSFLERLHRFRTYTEEVVAEIRRVGQNELHRNMTETDVRRSLKPIAAWVFLAGAQEQHE